LLGRALCATGYREDGQEMGASSMRVLHERNRSETKIRACVCMCRSTCVCVCVYMSVRVLVCICCINRAVSRKGRT
jgi:hypothetical protein